MLALDRIINVKNDIYPINKKVKASMAVLTWYNLRCLDMISTVIIGNSATYNFKDLMINPRGYKSKYNLEEPEIKNQ